MANPPPPLPDLFSRTIGHQWKRSCQIDSEAEPLKLRSSNATACQHGSAELDILRVIQCPDLLWELYDSFGAPE
jgi:hypothetical protein